MPRRFVVRTMLVLLSAMIAVTAADIGLRSLTNYKIIQTTQAQDEPAAPAEPPAAAPAAAPAAPAAAPAAGAAAPEQEEESVLAWIFKALGWRYTVAFLLLSFCLVALMVMNLLAARRDSVCPSTLVEQFEAHLNEKQYQEAYELAKSDESFLGKVLSAGLAKLSTGYDKAVVAMQEVGEDENMRIEHRLSYIALIGTISPMVGLLGTVDGMVQSFRVIATATAAPKPRELAEGISMALITTLVGLVLAIPALALFNILKNRFARLVLEAGIYSESLMGRFETVGKK
ncbi:MAG: Biopolymer transport protein ExbB [Planctomycetota bacterium]|jgi:biopolymer transport protein ExbB